jgi:hypothetical protein
MLDGVMVSVIMLSGVTLNVIMLIVAVMIVLALHIFGVYTIMSMGVLRPVC